MWGCSGWPAATPSSSLGAAGAGALATTTASSAAARSRVSQARTATGHELLTAGSAPMSGRRCPPRGRRDGRRVGRCRLPSVVGKPCLPTKRERACDQRPVPADGPIRGNLQVGPTELTLDLLVALLDPVPQPIQPHHLGQVGPLGAAAGRSSQVGQQVPAAVHGQPGRVGGGHHQPQPPIRTPAGQSGVGCPPGVGVAIAEAPPDASPLARLPGTLPAELTGRLDRSMGRLRRRPGALARLEGQHQPDLGRTQDLGEARGCRRRSSRPPPPGTRYQPAGRPGSARRRAAAWSGTPHRPCPWPAGMLACRAPHGPASSSARQPTGWSPRRSRCRPCRPTPGTGEPHGRWRCRPCDRRCRPAPAHPHHGGGGRVLPQQLDTALVELLVVPS
jgi:hypothetical protein